MRTVFQFVSRFLVWTAFAGISVFAGGRPEAASFPGGGEPLIRDAFADYVPHSSIKEFADVSVIPLEDGAPSSKAIRVHVRRVPADYWQTQIKWVNDQPVHKGDVLFFTAMARATDIITETGECRVTTSVNRGVSPFTSWGGYEFSVRGEWLRITQPYKVTEDLPAGHIQFSLNFGYAVQTLEVTNVGLFNYGDRVSIDDLPRPVVTYAGREPGAAWRAEADARIERIRKADLKIIVTDKSGSPESGLRISVEQTGHAFGFGTSVRAYRIMGTGSDNDRYRATLRTYFNRATFENEMKWDHWEQADADKQAAHRDETDRALDWLAANHLDVRGHCLIWPAWRFLPAEIRGMQDRPEELRTRIRERIESTAAHFSGKVIDWDVVNEPVNNFATELREALGRGEMVEWFRAARRGDPGAKLFLNDYTMLSGGARDTRRIEAFYDNVQFLLENGAPIDGIGEQAHFDSTLTAPSDIIALLDRFSRFGLPIEITEFDVASSDAALRADYTRDFYTAVFSHPSVTSITNWGFWAGNHWKPSAALWDRNWNLTPNGKVFTELVGHRWRTSIKGVSDQDGALSARGFLGDYVITVTSADGHSSRTVNATLTRQNTTVLVQLD